MYIELYNQEKKKLVKIKLSKLPKVIKTGIDTFDVISNNLKYILIPTINNSVYAYVQTKINIREELYFLNVIIKLDDKYISKMEDELYSILTIVFITILMIFIVMFPSIYSQYKKLLLKEEELLKSNLDTAKALGNAVAKRDSDTDEHNYRVTYYSVKIAQDMKLPNEEIKSLIKGAFLHDVGKIGISDSILLKQGKLTNQEFEIMKTHVMHGVEIIENIAWLKDTKDVILNHHEKVDGSGYPDGLKGDEIPLVARIFAVADVFDALTSKRPYKEPFSVEQSMEILNKDVVDAFNPISNKLYSEIFNKNKYELEIILSDYIETYFNMINYK